MSNRFVRAPSSGGGSNAPRPALSVLHLDVNAGRRGTRQARSACFVVFRAVYARAILGSWRMYLVGRKNQGAAFPNWHHFQIGI